MNMLPISLKTLVGVPLIYAAAMTSPVNAQQVDTSLCKSDCKMEFNFFRKYSKQGATLADLALSVMYHKGQGTKVNHKMGNRYLKRAAKSGEPGAQYQLGYFLQHGIFMERDLKRAEYWMTKASAWNLRDARARLAVIREQREHETSAAESVASTSAKSQKQALTTYSPPKEEDLEVIKISFKFDYRAVLEAARSQTCNTNFVDPWEHDVMAPMILLKSDQLIESKEG